MSTDQDLLAAITAGLDAAGEQADVPRSILVLIREIERLQRVAGAALRLRNHIRKIAYRDAANLRLGGDTVPFVAELDDALAELEL